MGTRVTREPEYGAEDLALLLAWQRIRDDFGPHGQPMSEVTSADADPATLGGYRYEVNRNPIIDRAQYALDKRRAEWEKAHPNADAYGHVWRVRKVDN